MCRVTLDVREAAYDRFEEEIWECRRWSPGADLRKDGRPND